MTQMLKLADDLFPAVREGTKTVTIRAGKRDIELGHLKFEGVNNPELHETVLVVRVSYTQVQDLTCADARMEEFSFPDELVAALRKFYPDLLDTDVVTVVEFV